MPPILPHNRQRFVRLDEILADPTWKSGLAHCAKDHRWYEIIAETMADDFDCWAFAVVDANGITLAYQPLFLVDQDVLATAPAPLRGLARLLRRFFPRFLKLRMLMIGCAVGEGQLASEDETTNAEIIRQLREALPQLAGTEKATLIVWKDFPAKNRPILSTLANAPSPIYTRVASMPATRLSLKFPSFDAYLTNHLSHATRKNLRRKFRATEGLNLHMSVFTSLDGVVDEVLPLYEQVRSRSPLQFERLNREFLLQLGARMPDRVRFFLWRLDDRLVAFSLCLVHDGALHDEYLGLDYRFALDLHLYFVTFRDVFTWALGQGLHTYLSTPLNYEPKLRLGFSLAPLDLYAVHPTPLFNRVLHHVLPWLQPASQEKTLQKFPNFSELEL